MKVKYTITEVQDWGDKWQVVYQLEKTAEAPDEVSVTTQHGHCFPKDIFEWRAAEYGFDPADFDSLLDVVLAEPFLVPEDFAPGESLHDAPDIDTAREKHRQRCARGKLRARISTRSSALRASGGVLDALRTSSPMDAEALALKRAHTEHVRQEFRRLPVEVDRIERLRKELKGSKENRG